MAVPTGQSVSHRPPARGGLGYGRATDGIVGPRACAAQLQKHAWIASKLQKRSSALARSVTTNEQTQSLLVLARGKARQHTSGEVMCWPGASATCRARLQLCPIIDSRLILPCCAAHPNEELLSLVRLGRSTPGVASGVSAACPQLRFSFFAHDFQRTRRISAWNR
jgi:hypothetical protein